MNFKTTVEREKERLNKRIPCLDPSCDLHGTTIVNNNGEPEPVQCEYCHRERFPLMEELEQAMTNAALAVVEEIENELSEEVKIYPCAHVHMTPRELEDEEQRIFGMNFRRKTILEKLATLKASLTTKE